MKSKKVRKVQLKKVANGVLTYPVPTKHEPVLICYVKGCRRKFKLTPADGISDKEFYSHT